MPLFWDIEGEASPELFFVSIAGFEQVQSSEDGGFETLAHPLPGDPSATFSPDRNLSVTIDLDGDHRDELIIFGRTVQAFKARDGVLTPFDFHPPGLDLKSLNDISVGDLNRDGRADLYFSMGRINWEHIHLNGRPDVLWIQRGRGRFEAHEISQPRHALTQGTTLADIDQDGWLDVIESVDTSWIAGPSRLMLNRTQAGARVPSFEPSKDTWDSGTEGRGVAVADLNQDGHLDLYASSVGHDLLAIGLPDGGFIDQTFEAGFTHIWTSSGPRYQWSPTITDLNLDGRLDILVRHGAPIVSGDALTTSLAQDLVYLQAEEGRFERQLMPTPTEADNGFSLAIGDLDQDGKPDVAKEGKPGALFVWRNATPLPADTHALSVHLETSVSASPPTGAIIEARCGEAKQVRHITSGGHMGAQGSFEVQVALQGCGGEATMVSVHFPSGATLTQEVAKDVSWVSIKEPLWVALSAPEEVQLDPTQSGAKEACLLIEGTTPQCCTEACTLNVREGLNLSAQLDEKAPMTLRAQGPDWLLVSDPPLLRPQSKATLTLLYVGQALEPPLLDLSLEVQGEEEALFPTGPRTLEAEVMIQGPAPMVTLVLKRAQKPISTWERASGFSFDALHPMIDLYPVHLNEPGFAQSAWEAMVHLDAQDIDTGELEEIQVATPDGLPLYRALSFDEGSERRARLTLPWDELTGLSGLWLYDHEGGLGVDLPVHQPQSDAEFLELLSHASCGLRRPRMRSGHDMSPAVLTLYTKDGHRMWVPPRLLELEVSGGRIDVPLSLKSPMRDLLFVVGSMPGEGTGEVRVLDTTGRELGQCSFTRRERESRTDELAHHTLTLSSEVFNLDSSESLSLELGFYTAAGELLGADAWPEVLVSGGAFTTPLYLSESGHITGELIASPSADVLSLSVVLEGKIIETREVPLVGTGPVRPSEPPETLAEESAPQGGCQSTDKGRSPWILALLFALGIRLKFRERERGHAQWRRSLLSESTREHGVRNSRRAQA